MAFEVHHNRKRLFTTGKHPFVTAVRREKEYHANRGTVTTTVVERERIALTEVRADGDTITFSAQGHSVTVTLRRVDGGVALDLTGEDGWAYEFRVRPMKGEAVFGGGEQYRQLNLRGERVVNFVAEHIKASTIVEKAVLPRALYRPKPHSKIGSYAPMPVFTTSAKRMFCFDTAADGFSQFDSVFCFSFDACPKSMTVLRAESFENLARAYAKLVPNRQYVPDWCREGLILSAQGGTQRIEDMCYKMLDAGAKISAVWSQDWSGEIRTVMGKQVCGTGGATRSSIRVCGRPFRD
jgi:alpha-glucosidase